VVVYVMDTVRSCSPVTFMSNMLYACSILYKMKLPFIIAMNKVLSLLILVDLWISHQAALICYRCKLGRKP